MNEIYQYENAHARRLSVLAYELNSLALAAAAEAATLARGGLGEVAEDGVLAEELDQLIRHLQHGTRAMRVARRRSHPGTCS